MIALVDCNNFFVSCERVTRPDLEGKPVVVLSNNDGCIISRSNEAKALGFKMAEPVFKVKEKFIREEVHVFSGNVSLYRKISKQVMRILRSECNSIEVYSIDEAFMDFKDVASPEEKAVALKEQVQKETGVPVSIGIAKTKVLAKLANRVAKKYSKSGVFLLTDKQIIQRALNYFVVEDLWGIGYRQAKFLNKKGIFNASQLAKVDTAWVRKYMNIGGVRLVRELNEIPCSQIQSIRPKKKSIMTSRSFIHDVSSFEVLNEALTNFASLCAFKLRVQNTKASKVSVFIQSNRYKLNNKIHNGYIDVNLPTPTNDSIEIIKQTHKALKKMFRQGYLYKRAGVIVSEISSGKEVQLSLFSNNDLLKRSKLMRVYDDINLKMGKDTLRLGVQGMSRKWNQNKEPIAFRN